MKIAIYNDWWFPQMAGGAERTALNLADFLAVTYGPENVHIFTISDSKNTYVDTHGNLTVTRIQTSTFRYKYSISNSLKFFEKMRIMVDKKTRNLVITELLNFNPDVILLHNVDRLGFRFVSHLKSVSKIPIARVQHDLGDTCNNRTRRKKISKKNCHETCVTCKFKESRYRKDSKHYNLMVSVSQFVNSTLSRLDFTPQHSTYGYPDVGKNFRFPDHFYFDNPSVLRLGFIGRVVPEKGLETVISAAFLANRDFALSVSVVICGTGDEKYLNRLNRLASDLDVNLIFLGHQQSPYETLRGEVDAIVVPSVWQEPLGRVPMESLSEGYPCFVSSIGGLLESSELAFGPLVHFDGANPTDLAEKVALSLSSGVAISKPKHEHRNLNLVFEKFCNTIENNHL